MLGHLIYKETTFKNLVGDLVTLDLTKLVKRKKYEIIYGRKSVKYLKKIIELDYPEINSVKTDEWERVNMLREWVAKNMPWGYRSTIITDTLWDKKIPEIFLILAENNGGINDGGIANALMKLYGLYGYESFIYDSGDNKWSRALTIVKIEHNNRSFFVVQDSTFNLTYTHKNGEPYDLLDLLSLVKKGEIGDIIPKISSKYHYKICKINDCDESPTGDVIYLKNNRIKFASPTYFEDVINLEKYIAYPYSVGTNSNKEKYEDVMRNIEKLTGKNLKVH